MPAQVLQPGIRAGAQTGTAEDKKQMYGTWQVRVVWNKIGRSGYGTPYLSYSYYLL